MERLEHEIDGSRPPGKRVRGGYDEGFPAAECHAAKIARTERPCQTEPPPKPEKDDESSRALRPAPFFFYRDFSTEVDPDPLAPLTAPGRVPNFPAKMHAILSRPDLKDVICWMPHGRSWRVLKPREFEIRVIPTYFEHAKFSSFIRQANGWGFRRLTQGRDRNSYYHELFLRGLPHLCKKMKRPGVAKKLAADPEQEPELYKISAIHPVPEKTQGEAPALDCTEQGGPRARMPIYSGPLPHHSLRQPSAEIAGLLESRLLPPALALPPGDQHALLAFQQSLGASENQLKGQLSLPPSVFDGGLPLVPIAKPPPRYMSGVPASGVSPLAVANQLAFPTPAVTSRPAGESAAASQFAAGFVAATALSQQQFQNILGSLGVSDNRNALAHLQNTQRQQQNSLPPSLQMHLNDRFFQT